jgi:hypothetical protein
MTKPLITAFLLIAIVLACDVNPNQKPLIPGEAKLIARVDNG